MLDGALNTLALYGHDVVLWTLIAASFITVVVAMERWLTVTRGRTSNRTLRGLTPAHVPLDTDSLSQLDEADGFEGRVAVAGLEAGRKGGTKAAEEAIAAQMSVETDRLERGLVIIGTVGSNAPFVGLLGTVLGIVRAFEDLGLDTSEGAASVMSGISEALVATAIGLLVAIPAVVLYNWLSRRNELVLQRLEQVGRIVLLQLTVEHSSHPGEPLRGAAPLEEVEPLPAPRLAGGA
ncbi:MAG: MotA/TolQ/ExbB proton channel family protein [Myxococcota bacterium]